MSAFLERLILIAVIAVLTVLLLTVYRCSSQNAAQLQPAHHANRPAATAMAGAR